VTILVFHISRQQGQPTLHVGQEFRLKAGPDFLQRINEPGHFVGPDPPQRGANAIGCQLFQLSDMSRERIGL
jgi:hypothetical protein